VPPFIFRPMSQSKLLVIDIPRPDGKARDNRWHVISISDSSWLGQDSGTESLTSFVKGGEVYTFRRAWKQQRLLRESGHDTVLLRADPYSWGAFWPEAGKLRRQQEHELIDALQDASMLSDNSQVTLVDDLLDESSNQISPRLNAYRNSRQLSGVRLLLFRWRWWWSRQPVMTLTASVPVMPETWAYGLRYFNCRAIDGEGPQRVRLTFLKP